MGTVPAWVRPGKTKWPPTNCIRADKGSYYLLLASLSSNIFSMAVSTEISAEQESFTPSLCCHPRKLKHLKGFCAFFSAERLTRLFKMAWTMCITLCFNFRSSLVLPGLTYSLGPLHSICSEWNYNLPKAVPKYLLLSRLWRDNELRPLSPWYPHGTWWPLTLSIRSSQRAILRTELGKWPETKFYHKRMESAFCPPTAISTLFLLPQPKLVRVKGKDHFVSGKGKP